MGQALSFFPPRCGRGHELLLETNLLHFFYLFIYWMKDNHTCQCQMLEMGGGGNQCYSPIES